MNYVIKIDDEEKGPLSAEQIRLRLAEKGLKGDDLVRREDGSEWVPLGSLQEFRSCVEAPVPQPNPLATGSLVLAYFSVPLGFLTEILRMPVFWIPSIAAIVCGHMAIRRINRSRLPVQGRGAARGGLWLGYFMTFIPLVLIVPPRGGRIQEKGNITKGISNCRQIITTLRLYSSDNKGKYPDAALPDAKSSNAVFRQMFVGEQADNEMIFGCPSCKDGVPDGNIGTKPDYREALQANENHWAMTKGLTDESDGKIPLVFENPQDATWSPKWNPDAVGTGKPGRTWKGGKVIIGFNDSSVVLVPLESASGEHVGLKPDADGKPVFPDLHPKPEILVPEVK